MRQDVITQLSSFNSGAYDTPTYRRVNREALILLGGGRALLMQLAMPGVAAGVDEHSDFRRRPLRRLWRTLSLTYRLSFGKPDEVVRAAAAINRAHASVQGKGYSARDPRLLLWVYATLVDSALVTYETFVQPLNAAEREDYYGGSKWVAPLLGLPASNLPSEWSDFAAYVERTVAEECAIDARARALGQRVLHPVPWLPAWVFAPAGDITTGLLPGSLRDAYQLGEPGRWYRWACRTLPRLRRRVPWLLCVPWARRNG